MKRVLAFGTFDILHPGHIDFLRRASKLGDYLIVSLSRRENAKKIKGSTPRHTESERRKLLEAVKYVDKVVIGAKTNYLDHILALKPGVIALGYDQKFYTEKLREKLRNKGLNAKIVRLKAYLPHVYKTRELKGSF